jgi:dipeptidyl aminopeptidase/acylaminoacyl peptidase
MLLLDFTGSGHSDGEYVSLGHYEQLDLQIAIEFLRGLPYIGRIGVWGRSMGAAT